MRIIVSKYKKNVYFNQEQHLSLIKNRFIENYNG